MHKNRTNTHQADDITSIERQTLRAICTGNSLLADIQRAIENLSTYAWREPEHATVFQAIQRVAQAGRAPFRDELPAQATRMGFPDVDWPQYFTASTNEKGGRLADLVSHLINFDVRKT